MTRPPLWDQLDQDEVWIDADMVAWPLEDMKPSHRRNLLAWFYRNAPRLQLEDQARFLVGALPSAGSAAFDIVVGGLMSELATTPSEWAQEQPLIARLTELVGDDESEAS